MMKFISLIKVLSVSGIAGIVTFASNSKVSAASITISPHVPGSFPSSGVWESGLISISTDPNGEPIAKGQKITINAITNNVVLYDGGSWFSTDPDEKVTISAKGGIDNQLPANTVKYSFSVGSITGTASTDVKGNFSETLSKNLASPGSPLTITTFKLELENDGPDTWNVTDVSVKLQATTAVPEPMTTLLGSSLALGFGGLLKRASSRKQKKLKNKAII